MTVGERMARLEEKVDNIAEKLDTLVVSIDGKFAGKWVERVIIFIASAVVLGFFAAYFLWLFRK
jgi:hypothetical protein